MEDMSSNEDYINEDAETRFECERMAKLTGLTPQMVYELWCDYSETMLTGYLHGMATMTADQFNDAINESVDLRYAGDPGMVLPDYRMN